MTWLAHVPGTVVIGLAACGRIGFDALGDARRGGGGGDGGSVVDGGAMLSCAGLAATCGPTGASSCCGSPLVPAGTFYRSYDVASDGMFPDMTSPATVSAFRLDTYEVTVGRFRVFVDAGMGTQTSPPPVGAGARTLNGMTNQAGWESAWDASLATDTAALGSALFCDTNDIYNSWTATPGTNEALPMNCITWYEAFAFCTWDGGFLPTEAQWNYAAAGGSDQRAYPWSNPAGATTIACAEADYYIDTPPGTYCVNDTTGGVNRVGNESPMGDGLWGQADLGGNLWEYTLDWQAAYVVPCNDCADLTSNATGQVIRGGGFFDEADNLRTGNREGPAIGGAPSLRHEDVGVRCARSP